MWNIKNQYRMIGNKTIILFLVLLFVTFIPISLIVQFRLNVINHPPNVHISSKFQESSFKRTLVAFTDPLGEVRIMPKSSLNGDLKFTGSHWLSALYLIIHDTDLKNLKNIKVELYPDDYSFDYDALNSKWTKVNLDQFKNQQEEGFTIFKAPSVVSRSQFIMPSWELIDKLYKKGEFTTINTLSNILFLLFILLAILPIVLFIFTLPKRLSANSLQSKTIDFFSKSDLYHSQKDYYVLNERITFVQAFRCWLFFHVYSDETPKYGVKPNVILGFYIVLQTVMLLIIKTVFYSKSLITNDGPIYANMLWNTNFFDKFLYSDYWLYDSGFNTFLNVHFSPTLSLLAPIMWLFSSTYTLIIISSIIPGVSAILLYSLLKKIWNRPTLALIIAITFMFHPSIINATVDVIYGFHPDGLTTPIIFLGLLFFIKRKWTLYFVILILFLGLKENLPIMGALFGFGLVIWRKDLRTIGFITLFVSMFIFILGVKLFPIFTGVEHQASQIINKFITPGVIFDDLYQLMGWVYFLHYLPGLLTPYFILVFPEILMLLLSNRGPINWHIFPMFSILVVATMYGFKSLYRKSFELKILSIFKINSRRLIALSIVLLLFTLVTGIPREYYLFMKSNSRSKQLDIEKVRMLDEYIPKDAALALQSHLYTHFIDRPHLVWPNNYSHGQYFILHLNQLYPYDYDNKFIEGVKKMAIAGDIVEIYRDIEFVIYKRN